MANRRKRRPGDRYARVVFDQILKFERDRTTTRRATTQELLDQWERFCVERGMDAQHEVQELMLLCMVEVGDAWASKQMAWGLRETVIPVMRQRVEQYLGMTVEQAVEAMGRD